MKKKFLLGIACYYHDSSACLLGDGEILNAVQEERFTRIKNDSSFPANSIKFILKKNLIKLTDIDAIIFYEKPFLKFERLLETHLAFAPKGFKSFLSSIPVWLKDKLFQKKLLFDELKNIDKNFNTIEKLKFSEHHLSHAASAFFPSPFNSSSILTLDGVGEWATSTIGYGEGKNLDISKEINFPHSIGLLYSAFTYYLGFKVNDGEYKLMGLAPYGEPKYKKIIYDNLIDVKDDGSYKLDMSYFDYATGLKMTNSKFNDLLKNNQRFYGDNIITKEQMNIASSIQQVTEEIILKICKNIKKDTGSKNLCLAGGVALNCVANGKIIKEKIFENIWIQPASGDAGGSLGACLAYWHNQLNEDRPQKKENHSDNMCGSLLGPEFSDIEIKEFLDKNNVNFRKLDENELYQLVSDEIISGKAIGWFQGKMEFGPRALGNRSIIADARSEKMQKNLNLKVKFRESFRPFAPIVLEEKTKEYFDINEKSPYMLKVAKINNNKILNENENKLNEGFDRLKVKRSEVPAITHVDYSARIQTVSGVENPRLYKLLKTFYEKTNCPILINTSFNINNEPIVCDLKDAFNCFQKTNIDILVLGNFIISK